jgi:hypothetical protein
MFVSEMTKVPTVFISYAWTNGEKVEDLAERLVGISGVDVKIDIWDLKPGQDKYAFMEQCVNNPNIDKVLIVCDKAYTEKANAREGGVGDETVIISSEIYGNINQEKFIPVIFEKDDTGEPFVPAYIKSRIYIDLSSEEDEKYEAEYEKLLRNIYKKPSHRKPALGKPPEWLENETTDFSQVRSLIKQVKGLSDNSGKKVDFALRQFKDAFIVALMAIKPKEGVDFDEALLIQIDESKTLRDLMIDFLEAMLYKGLSTAEVIADLLENIYNMSHNFEGCGSHSENEFEFYNYFIWESLICTTAVFLHYERYVETQCFIAHTYFKRESPFSGSNLAACRFVDFTRHCPTIENVCKQKSATPNLYTLAGDMLIKREKRPILTKNSMAEADILLCQMSTALDIKSRGGRSWFPALYIYRDEYSKQPLWYKLKSREHCSKVMPLFGVSTLDELKQAVAKSVPDREIRYSGSFESAPTILHSIELDEIGSMV